MEVADWTDFADRRAGGGELGASVASGDGDEKSFKIISRDYDSVNTPISDSRERG